MKKFIKKPIFIVLLIVVLVAAVGGYFIFFRKGKNRFELTIVGRGDIIQEVSATGKVKPTESVDLAFEKTGKVADIFVKIGDRVETGQNLIKLENSELSAQLLEAEANLASEQAKLDELIKGKRPEEIKIAETKVANAESSLKFAEENLDKIRNKADADLKSIYYSAAASVQSSVIIGKNALITLSDIQFSYFFNTGQDSNTLADAKALAMEALFDVKDAGRWNSQFISQLESGTFKEAQEAVDNPVYDKIDSVLVKIMIALQKIKNALEEVAITTAFTNTEKTNLETAKTNIGAEIVTISGKQQSIAVQRTTNESNIITAQISYSNAKNSLNTAQDELALDRAGSTPEEIAAQRAKVLSARANISNIRAQLSKTVLSAPLTGVVTKQNTEIGEIVSANSPIISLISEVQFEVETNIAEADIAKIKVSNPAKINLDAYGSDLIFDATVAKIDPAEIVIEGVATYKTTLYFVNKDERIKSGMTANIDILTQSAKNVLLVPQRVIISRNGDKIVQIFEKNKVKEIKVKTGLRGSDGNVEILEGLKEGDKVIANPKS